MSITLNFNNQYDIENCEVCCRPIKINFAANDGVINLWRASRVDELIEGGMVKVSSSMGFNKVNNLLIN